MEWNNGKERAKFERDHKKLREEYLALGMTEDQIHELYILDLEWFNRQRTEARHTQSLDIDTSEDDEIKKDSPLYKKFFRNIVSQKDFDDDLEWTEQIDDKELYHALKTLTSDELQILTKYAISGLKVTDIASSKGVSHQAISKKISKIKKKLEKWLRKSL